jgi:hypothetical protein
MNLSLKNQNNLVFSKYYKLKKASQVSAKDQRIALVGNIAQRKPNSFVLDDGTAKIEIAFEGNLEAKTVRAFCSVEDEKIKADLIQNLDGLDLNLFKRVDDLYSKVFYV